jgi:hypothetical protein
MPEVILDILSQKLKPEKLVCRERVPGEDEKVICREDRALDFSEMDSYFLTTKVALDSKGLPTKAAMKKMLAKGKWEEIIDVRGLFGEPKDAPRSSSFRIASAIYLIAKNNGILEEGSKLSLMLQTAPEHEFIQRMLDLYLSRERINESALLPGLSFSGKGWASARRAVVEMLKTLEPGKFYSYEKFEEWARLTCRRFLDNEHLYGSERLDYGYDYAPWERNEHRVLQAFLCCFCALGIVDLSFKENKEEQYKAQDHFMHFY